MAASVSSSYSLHWELESVPVLPGKLYKSLCLHPSLCFSWDPHAIFPKTADVSYIIWDLHFRLVTKGIKSICNKKEGGGAHSFNNKVSVPHTACPSGKAASGFLSEEGGIWNNPAW